MPIRSHVDLCVYVKFLHVRRRDISEQTLALLDQDLTDAQVIDLYLAQQNNMLETDFHETYHFWQGLRLPYLHRYAVLTFLAASAAFRELSTSGVEWRNWAEVTSHRMVLPGQPRYLIPRGGELFYSKTAVADDAAVALSSTDLLETAASLAEFQVLSSKPDRTDIKAFGRWTKRRPTYRAAVDLAVSVLGDAQLALRCTLPAINAAFHTTDPVRTYGQLMSQLAGGLSRTAYYGEFTAKPEPCQWGALFAGHLDLIKFDHDGNVLDILDQSYARLDLNQWIEIQTPWSDEHGAHPFLSRRAAQWSALQEQNPVFGWLLDQPGYVGGQNIEDAIDRFAPITIMRFHAGTGRDRVIRMGRPGDDATFIKSVLAMYGTIRRATRTHFDPESRLCPHTECPQYERNYCNCFISVPAHWNQCEFPIWMADNITAVRDEYGGVHVLGDNDRTNAVVMKVGENGEDTEDLISYVVAELADPKINLLVQADPKVNLLDEVEIDRQLHRPDDMAGEPITIGVLVVCGTVTATIAVGRIVERWMENKRQEKQIKLTIAAFTTSEAAGKAVAEIAKKNAGTELTKLPKIPAPSEWHKLGAVGH
jgi:hypothetical protein